MPQVTLYNITEEKVWVESFDNLRWYEMDKYPLVSDYGEAVCDATMKVHDLPIYKHHEITPYGEEESYIALTPQAEKALGLEHDKFNNMSSAVTNMKHEKVLAKLHAKNCQDELDKVKRATFIDRLIWLFTGGI